MDAATPLSAAVVDALESAGHMVAVRTGGGTGTALLDIEIEIGVLNELQGGSYVSMGRGYRGALDGDLESVFAQNLTVVTIVFSVNQVGFVTVDAGLKSTASDAGVPVVVVGHPDSTYAFFGDEQRLVTATAERTPVRDGRVVLVPPHCDPTVDRHDRISLIRNGAVVDGASVTARGCSC
jgi:D-serine deaminase-like pyridoxal phosphate-dependent protein